VAVFVLVPFLDTLRRAFMDAMATRFVGLANYFTIFASSSFKLAGLNTLKFIGICIPMLLIISLVLSLLLNELREKNAYFKTIFLFPMAVPIASIVLLWRVMFHQQGILSQVVLAFGGQPKDWMNSSAAFAVLVFSYLWKNVGYDTILWMSGLSGLNPSMYEAAQIDGAGKIKQFFFITLPNLMPTFFTITVISLLNSFKVFREAYLISGDYPHESIFMLQHLFNNWFAALDVEKMCAGASVLAALIFLVILVLKRSWEKEV